MFIEGSEETVECQVLSALSALSVAAEEVESYGSDPAQFIEWYGPVDGDVIVFVHGGGFRSSMDLAYARPAALALGEDGFRVALVESRKEHGNPVITLADLRTLARREDFAEAMWLGHSLGATLVWNIILEAELAPHKAVLLAPFWDLAREINEQGDASGLIAWIGDDLSLAEHIDPHIDIEKMSPTSFANGAMSIQIIVGDKDAMVPASRIRGLAELPIDVAIVPGANHIDLVLPDHDAWLFLLGALHHA